MNVAIDVKIEWFKYSILKYSLACMSIVSTATADNTALQHQLMSIASQQAQIAGIGANKSMMLYGVGNPIQIINKWNEIEHKPKLTNKQIDQINELNAQKQSLLKRGLN